MSVKLTVGSIARLHYAEPDEEDIFASPHTLQILSIKKLNSSSSATTAADRYRIILSDGEYFTQAMPAVKLNPMIENNTIMKHTVILVEEMSNHFMQQKRLLIIRSLRAVEHFSSKIGDPGMVPDNTEFTPPVILPASSSSGVESVPHNHLNPTKKTISNLQDNYELNFGRHTEIKGFRVPTIQYHFTPLSDLQDLPKGSVCDVIGVVEQASTLSKFISKQSRPVSKQELTLVDKSGSCVRLMLLGKHSEQYIADNNPVIVFQGVKVNDSGGHSLSMLSSSTMQVNPHIDECFVLRGWYDMVMGNRSKPHLKPLVSDWHS